MEYGGETGVSYAPDGARQLYQSAKCNAFLSALPATDFSLLAPHLRIVPLECGATLHDVGEQIKHVYFPKSGMVSLVIVMQSGAAVETGSVGRAGIIGATAGLGSRRAFGKAVVQITGDAAGVAASQFRVATKESDVIRNLIIEYNDFVLSQIQQSVACNALHDLQPRLCRWLLQTGDCVGSDRIPVTQELISQMLGVRRTTLTVVARLLQKMDAIQYRRGLIHIVNRAKLEENACECYAEVKRKTDKLFLSTAGM